MKIIGVLTIGMLIVVQSAVADQAADLQALKDAKTMMDAQAAKDVSEAAAVKAAADLAKAKAAASSVDDDIQKSKNDAAAGLVKSQVGAQTALIDALKASFGTAPSVGSDGAITISDQTNGILLEIKKGSLEATWLMSQKLCGVLEAANIQNAFVAPVDLDTKIQNSRMVLREFNALHAKVSDPSNRKLVGLDGVTAQVAPAAILGAVSLLQYGAGALQSVAKLFKSDIAVGLSSDASRVGWLEYFSASNCPDRIPQAQLESVVRNQSIDDFVGKLNSILEFSNAATATKAAIQGQITLLTGRISDLTTKKQDPAFFQAQLDSENKKLLALAPVDAFLPRLQALLTAVSTSPATFLDALTWYAFGDDGNPLKISGRPRLTLVLTTQDGQITENFWLTGKSIYGRSSAELIYRVQQPSGEVSASGFLTASASTGKINFNRDFQPAPSGESSVKQKPAASSGTSQ